MQDVYLEQLYTFGELSRGDDARPRRRRHLLRARAARAGAPARERRRGSRRGTASTSCRALAFDNNAVVDYAVRRLRSKLDYTNVAYSLLPRQFTLSELQQVYEAILDRELDKRNFRRRMLSLGIIKPAGGTRMEGAHRPAQLFTFTRREPVQV